MTIKSLLLGFADLFLPLENDEPESPISEEMMVEMISQASRDEGPTAQTMARELNGLAEHATLLPWLKPEKIRPVIEQARENYNRLITDVQPQECLDANSAPTPCADRRNAVSFLQPNGDYVFRDHSILRHDGQKWVGSDTKGNFDAPPPAEPGEQAAA